MSNQTTTEAAIDDVPVGATDKLASKSATSKPPLSGQTAASTKSPGADMKATGGGEGNKTTTVHPLTTEQTKDGQHTNPVIS